MANATPRHMTSDPETAETTGLPTRLMERRKRVQRTLDLGSGDDLDAARALVRHELKVLNRAGDDIEMLRHTAQAFVTSGYSYAAVASSQHIHRNTALQRVKWAQDLRGRPLTERPAELLAALPLIDTIGASLLEG